MAFSVLTVCTANICRSATAERALRTSFARNGLRGVVEVSSAGVAARPGAPMCSDAAALLAESRLAGGPSESGPDAGHVSRRLSAAALLQADLVLTADRGHLGAAGALAPQCRSRLFTIRQAAALLDWVIGGSGVLEVARLRASGVDPELDALDPLVEVPALPPVATARLDWLMAELDAARGTAPLAAPAYRLATGADRQAIALPWESDDVGDPHELGFEYHPDSVRLIVDGADSIGRAFAVVLA